MVACNVRGSLCGAIALSGVLLLFGCGGEEPGTEQTPVDPPANLPVDQPPAPVPDPVAGDPSPEPVLQDTEVTERLSAFDSNQWNSAVGLGGGAGGMYSGRGGGRTPDLSAESYAALPESGFLDVRMAPLSTFAADVDTASFSNVRRYLGDGMLPPAGAVRLEEMVNAFSYGDPDPVGNEPFAVTAELGRCPWSSAHHLVRLGVKTKSIDASRVPPCNLVFLLDVSGSMRSPDKLPLLKRAMALLVDQLRPQDHVAIVTYASGVKVVLEGARGDEKAKIRAVLEELRSGGSTAGAGGIQKAYEIARQHRVAEGVNRVILATDGDFNVGISSPDALHAFITEQKQDNVFLTVLGFGTGNLKDDRLEILADKGNGVYAYIDDLTEGRRVLVEQFGASMMTVAKDVKFQVEFNPRWVAGYRLLGYENRRLADRDFKDDKKDGGEMGAGHSVTALYEVVPVGQEVPGLAIDPLKYQETVVREGSDAELLTVKIRFKPPLGDTSREVTHPMPVLASVPTFPSRGFRLAATVAGFAMLLKDSSSRGVLTWDLLAAWAEDLDRENVEQAELCRLIESGRGLARAEREGEK